MASARGPPELRPGDPRRLAYLHGLGLARLQSPQVSMSWTKSLNVTVTRSSDERQFGMLIVCSRLVSPAGR